MKKQIFAILMCTALLASAFTGCGNSSTGETTTTTTAATTTAAETTTQAATTEAETTTESNVKDGVYSTKSYSISVPEGWTCDGNDSMVMMLPSEDMSKADASINIVSISGGAEIYDLKYDDFKASMDKSLGTEIEKKSFGIQNFGENKVLFSEFSAEVQGQKMYMSAAYVLVNDTVVTLTLTEQEENKYDDVFKTILESVKAVA